MLDGWRHSGFNVFAGERIQPREKKSLENLAAYLIRATFSQKRMEYSPEQATVVYRSKDGKDKKTYDALEWLAAMACHVPERGKQSIRYYGAYANSVRGKQRKRQEVEPIPTVLEPVISSEAFRRNWARPIQEGLRSFTLGLSPMQKGNASRSVMCSIRLCEVVPSCLLLSPYRAGLRRSRLDRSTAHNSSAP